MNGEENMTQLNVILMIIILFFAESMPGVARADAEMPFSVGGVTLGTSIEYYIFVSQENFVVEVIVTGIKVFRKGYILYGACERPGEILRIKLKYKDKSVKFFNQLLEQYKNKFSSKPKFVGDSFGLLKAWKWSFNNDDGVRVSLVLQHNLKDADESTGNMVKLSFPDRLIAERKCSNKSTQPDDSDDKPINGNWGLLLPD